MIFCWKICEKKQISFIRVHIRWVIQCYIPFEDCHFYAHWFCSIVRDTFTWGTSHYMRRKRQSIFCRTENSTQTAFSTQFVKASFIIWFKRNFLSRLPLRAFNDFDRYLRTLGTPSVILLFNWLLSPSIHWESQMPKGDYRFWVGWSRRRNRSRGLMTQFQHINLFVSEIIME